MDQAQAEVARRWRRRIIVALAVTALAISTVLPFILGVISLYAFVQLGCIRTQTPADYGMAFEHVTLTMERQEIEAYFIPAETEAAVILAPTFRGDAGILIPFAEVLHERGVNILALPSRRCRGERQTLGYLEAEEVAIAYEYLKGREGIDPDRVSAHGFSAAGAAALFAAARIPELAAVSAMGNYVDMHAEFGVIKPSDNIVERSYKVGARLGYRLGSGISVEKLRPIEIIPEIAPRPILMIYGTTEVAFSEAQAIAEAWEDSVTFVAIPGGGHGDYFDVAPELTAQALGDFHYEHLLLQATN